MATVNFFLQAIHWRINAAPLEQAPAQALATASTVVL
jgi:hypothetical protein